MSKVEILRLDSVTANDTSATLLLNTNFQNIQEAIEKTLSRTGDTPNYMLSVLDMNSNRIINTTDPIEDLDVVNLRYLRNFIGNIEELVARAEEAATAATEKAQDAAGSATSAAQYAEVAQNAANVATQKAIEAEQVLEDIKEYVVDNALCQYSTMPEPSAELLGKIIQYVGPDDGFYGHGFIYECKYMGPKANVEQIDNIYYDIPNSHSLSNLLVDNPFVFKQFADTHTETFEDGKWDFMWEWVQGSPEPLWYWAQNFGQPYPAWNPVRDIYTACGITFSGTPNYGDLIRVTFIDEDYYWDPIQVMEVDQGIYQYSQNPVSGRAVYNAIGDIEAILATI